MRLNFLLVILLLFIATGSIQSQIDEVDRSSLWANPTDRDFSNLQTQMEEYYEDKDKGRGSGYKQWKRFEYQMQNKLDNKGHLTNVAARNQKALQDYFSKKSSMAQTGEWEMLAPTTWTNTPGGYNPGIGRVNEIAFHPSDEDIFYIGTPNGGIWATRNGGISWAPLHDGMPSLGVSGIKVHHTDPDIIYILTGDGDGGNAQSIGVLKTYDGGSTWKETGLSWDIDDFEKGYQLVMHPTDANTLLAATTDGIYKTTDGGDTWTQEATGTFRDIQYHPTDASIVYAEKSADFYRSADGGDSWTKITAGLPSDGQRFAIAVSPAQPDYVYLLMGPATGVGSFKGFYRSTDAGLNFSTRGTTPNILGYSSTGGDDSSQSWYDIAVAAHPATNDKVYTGGINVWKTTDGGSTYSNISQWVYGGTYTHADIHCLEYNPLNNNLYCGSDGGIFESTDGGDTWTDISGGLSIMQFYKIAGVESDSDYMLGGTQDNGSNKWTGGTDIDHIRGADGMDCMIDHTHPDTIYYSWQNGGLHRSYNGGTTRTYIKPSGSSGSWVTPYVMDPTNSSIIYGGYSDVFRSTDRGSNWTNKGADGRSGLAIGTDDPTRLYAARNTTLRMTSNSGDSWTDVTGPWSGQNVTGITVNPDDSEEVYVTVSGYSAGKKVYKSTDAGASWTNLSGTLPNIPHNCIIFQDNNGSPGGALYVGTDIGVFYRDDDLGDWIPFRNGLPTVEVKDLEINYGTGVIRAGTYGRSIWTSPLYSPCPDILTLTKTNNPGQTSVSTGYQYYQASDAIISSRFIGGGIGTYSEYRAATSVELVGGFTVEEGSAFYGYIGPCIAGVPTSGLGDQTENMTQHDSEDLSELSLAISLKKDDALIENIEIKTPEAIILTITIESQEKVDEVIYQNNYFPIGVHSVFLDKKLDDNQTLVIKDAFNKVLFKE